MSGNDSESKDDSHIICANIPKNVLIYVKSHAKKGDVLDVISAIDKYTVEKEKSIIIGEEKGNILDELIRECRPSLVLELGSFFGYSALRMARLMTRPECMIYTVEAIPEFAKIAQEIIEFAGMKDRITVLLGDSVNVIPALVNECLGPFDFVLLDHWKEAYKRDLIKLEDLKLMKKGSVVLADNVIYPGCPDYLEYVRNNPKYDCTNYPAKDAFTDISDAMEKSVYCG